MLSGRIHRRILCDGLPLRLGLRVVKLLWLLSLLTLLWDQDDPQGVVSKFRIYSSASSSGTYILLKTVTTKSTTIRIPAGVMRCYKIKAVDTFGQASPFSGALCLTGA